MTSSLTYEGTKSQRGGATERGIGRRGQLGHGMAYISPQCEAFIHDDIRPFKHRSIHMYIGPA